jgi:hypothetical protein
MSTLVKTLFGEEVAWAIFPWSLIAVGILLAAWCALGAVFDWREGKVSGGPGWPGLVILGIGAALAVTGLWLLLRPDQRSEQERAVAAIKRLKGEVTVDEKAPGRPVVKVSFREAQWPAGLTDADLAGLKPHLETLSQLRELDLCRTDVTDKGLSELRGLTQLKTLTLGSQLFPGRLSANGLNEVRKALPNTEVYWYRMPNLAP